jgi:hypothetical protein
MDRMLGRCLCGAVSYELDPPLASAAHCHCTSCRRAHSAAFVSWGTVLAAQLRVTAGADRLVGYASSPGARRSFCGTCGSQLFMRYEAEPRWAYVALASLTTPPDRVPDRHYSFEERVAWFTFHDELPRCRAKSSRPAG